MSNYYIPKENVVAEHRADVALIRSDTKQPIALIDIKTVTPTTRHLRVRAKTQQGYVANHRYDDTIKHYTDKFVINNPNEILPFVIERGGFIHPASKQRLFALVRKAFTTLDITKTPPREVTDWPRYRAATTKFLERVQTAVQKSNAWALLNLRKRLPNLVAVERNNAAAPPGAAADDDAVAGTATA